MLLTKWIEKAAVCLMFSDKFSIGMSVESPIHLENFLMERYSPKEHQAALLLKDANSPYVLFLDNPLDVPIFNVIDPITGRFLIKYEECENPLSKSCMRIEHGEN